MAHRYRVLLIVSGHLPGEPRPLHREHCLSEPGAVAGSLPPARFATGSAVYGMTRQFGAALAVAVLVAMIDVYRTTAALAAFQTGWAFVLAAALAAALAATMIDRTGAVALRAVAVTELGTAR